MDNNSSQDARYAPPQAHVADVETDQEGAVLATRWSRLVAAIVDGLAAGAALWLVSKITPWNPWASAEASFWAPQPMSVVVGFLLFMVLHGYLLATRGQTIGKYLLKIRITRSDGSRADIGRLLGLRYGVGALSGIFLVAAQIYGLLDALLIFRSSRKCLHDNIADTIVVKA